MKQYKILSTLINRDGWLSTIWSTIQQLVVAASTFFIVRSIAAATEARFDLAMAYLIAFVTSLILVYLPATVSLLYLQRWRLSSFERYVDWFSKENFGKTTFGHDRNKTKHESWLTNESMTVYGNVTGQLYDMYSTFLNSSLNILVIALALDKRLLGWYAGVGIVLLASSLVFSKKIETVSIRAQDGRKNLTNTLLSAWDNVFIGNLFNLENWRKIFGERVYEAKASALQYDLVRSLISSLTVILALTIVAAGNAFFLFENRENVAKIAALLVSMPRQLQIVQSIFAFFNMLLSWKGDYAQLLQLEKVARSATSPIPSENYVQMNAIDVIQRDVRDEFENVQTFIKNMGAHKHGRWTLRGKNGAGKSTLLSLFKEASQEKGFYLPSDFGGLKFEGEFLGQSSGNRLLSVFSEIQKLDVRYVLLDEWDANLDASNMAQVHQAIDQLAVSKVVIESRHRVG